MKTNLRVIHRAVFTEKKDMKSPVSHTDPATKNSH